MFANLFQKYAEIKDRREDGEGGFTLIELLVVVVIIGILVAIAIPLYLNYTNGAKKDSIKSDIRNAVTAIQQCYSDNNQALPATIAPVAAPAFAESACSADKLVVSDGTATLGYTKAADGNSYTITAVDTNGTSHTYTSTTGTTS